MRIGRGMPLASRYGAWLLHANALMGQCRPVWRLANCWRTGWLLAGWLLAAWWYAVAALPARTAEPAAGPLPGYSTADDLAAQVRALDAHACARVISLGATQGGREVLAVSLSAADGESRPAILVLGAVHPPHFAGAELALRVARLLAERGSTEESVRDMLTRFTIYVVPLPSPDASAACAEQPWYERTANLRETDDDADGRVDEDPPDDLDGDGWIAQLRVADPDGTHVPHPLEPRILVPVDPARRERGQYRLLVEGLDNDKDGQFQEDGPGGTAFNRNFTFRYPYFQSGAGPHQVSEPETRALADFAFAHPNIGLVFSFSLEDNLFHTWKPADANEGARIKTALLRADSPHLELLAEEYRKLHGGADAPAPPAGEGSFSEWAYFHYGRWSLAARAWWLPQVPPPAPAPADASDDQRGAFERNALRWLAQEGIDGFVDWQPVEHPDFAGKTVEVGGFKPFLLINPPAAELDALAEKHLAYLVRLTQLWPRLELRSLEAMPLGDGIYRIRASLANEGELPTLPEMGRISNAPYPLRYELELPEGARLLTGTRRGRWPVLAARGGHVEQTWLLAAPASAAGRVRLVVASPAVGTLEREIELP